MDAPGGEVDGEVRRLRPAPVQQGRGGVVEGVEGGHVLLAPAHVPQGAAPADHLCRAVEDDGRVLLLPGRRRAEALAEGAQGLGAEPEPLADALGLPGGLPPGNGRLPQQQGAVVAEKGRQGRAGGHAHHPLGRDAHLDGVSQLHRQGGRAGGGGAEEGELEPSGIPEGGEHRADEHQDPPQPQGRAEGQKHQRPDDPAAQGGDGLLPRPAGGQEPRRQGRAALQSAPGGQKARQAEARQPDQPRLGGLVQGDSGDFHSLSPSSFGLGVHGLMAYCSRGWRKSLSGNGLRHFSPGGRVPAGETQRNSPFIYRFPIAFPAKSGILYDELFYTLRDERRNCYGESDYRQHLRRRLYPAG